MNKLLFILGVSFGSLFLGYALRRLAVGRSLSRAKKSDTLSKNLKLLCTFVLNPITVFDSFWRISLDFRGLVVFPLLGLLSLAVGAAAAVFVNRIFRIPPFRAASIFVSGMFTNLVSFGGLIAYVFFGYQGYGYVQLFNMFSAFVYYGVGFPVSERLSQASKHPFALSPKLLLGRPYIFIPLVAMAAGLLLNLLAVPQVPFIDSLSSFLIPFIAGLMGFSIGLTMYFGKIREYRIEVALIAAIKFFLVPLIMLPIGVILGLQTLSGGLPFKVLVVLSFMPVAFNALVPPALYGFDLDLANSGWIVTTLALVIIVPALSIALGV